MTAVTPIDAYWWSPRRAPRVAARLLWQAPALWATKVSGTHTAFTNHGDELNAVILPELTGRPVRWVPLGREDLVGIGSLLDLYVRHGGRGQVLGSGAVSEDAGVFDPARVAVLRDRILAVRGPMTRDTFGLDARVPLGDPGLAVRAFGITPRSRRSGRVFVAHYREYADRRRRSIVAEYRRAGFRIAHPTTDAREMIRLLGAAEYVVSSGMHGVILANALETPVTLVSLDDLTPAMPGRKYRDYFASVGLPVRVSSWRAALRDDDALRSSAERDIATTTGRIDDLVAGLYRAAAPLRSTSGSS